MEFMKKEDLEKVSIGDAIHPNAKYRDVIDLNNVETGFFIEEKDVLFVRDFFDGGFIVELNDDIISKNENRDFLYGYFKIKNEMISPSRWYDDFNKKNNKK